jgi:hypothetical protein
MPPTRLTSRIAAIAAVWPLHVGASEMPRIRPAGEYEMHLLTEGACRSETLRGLVTKLEESDLIVYVLVRRLETRSLTGGLQFVGATTTDRVIRVVLDTHVDRQHVMAILGHEFQHAVEVANAPGIRTREAFEAYYRVHGLPSRIEDAHDSLEARDVEATIRIELGRRSQTCK